MPNELDRCTAATSFVCGPTKRSNSSQMSSPSSSIGTTRRSAPVCSQSSCHGTMFEWCSMPVMTISSPFPIYRWPKLCATRLIPSVALRVKITLSSLSCVQKPLSSETRRLVCLGCHLTEVVNTAMDVRVVLRVIPSEHVEYDFRFLSGCRVIKVRQAGDLELPDPKIGKSRRTRATSKRDGASGRCRGLAHRRLPGRNGWQPVKQGPTQFHLNWFVPDLDSARRWQRPESGFAEPPHVPGHVPAGKTSASSSNWPTVAPWVHFTSSAKISSCGLVFTCASSERSSALFDCFASVFWASRRTMIFPLKTALPSPSKMPL